MNKVSVIDSNSLLNIWQGNRNLTRRIIDAFPEDALFNFSVGGMRPFAELVKEIITVDVDGLKGIVTSKEDPFDHNLPAFTKEDLLKEWDKASLEINQLFPQITAQRFEENFNLFGQYNFPVIHNIIYFIENQIHHRGQAYVYLRALGITPPFFWER